MSGAAEDTWPSWFGRERALFGWWHVPSSREARATIVMAPALARERLAADFSWRLLASSLASAGFAVLRFDFTATCDSSGRSLDGDLVGHWQEDLQTATATARAASSAPVILLGHRLGATLATQAVRDGLLVDALVLWDPVAKGRRYMRELAAQQTMAVTGVTAQARPAPAQWADVPGDDLSTETAAAISRLSLSPEQPIPAEALLVLARPHSPSLKTFATPGCVHDVTGLEEMLNLNPLLARPAEEPVAETVTWLDATMGQKTFPIEPPAAPSATMLHDGHEVVERAQRLVNGMFGVITERADAPPDPETVVLLSASVEPHTGPGRLWVELARDWAAMGLRVVRCDLPGLGESVPRAGAHRQTVYAPTAIEDLELLVRTLSPQDPSAVSLVGMCSGGYNALEVAARLRSRRLMLFAFGWWLVPAEFAEGKAPDPHRRAFLSAMNLLRPILYTGFGRRFLTKHPERMWLTGSALRLMAPLRPFRRLLRAGTEVTMLLGEADTAYFTKQPRAFERLRKRPGFQFRLIPGLDHALLNGEPRRMAGEMIRAAFKPRADPWPGNSDEILATS